MRSIIQFRMLTVCAFLACCYSAHAENTGASPTGNANGVSAVSADTENTDASDTTSDKLVAPSSASVPIAAPVMPVSVSPPPASPSAGMNTSQTFVKSPEQDAWTVNSRDEDLQSFVEKIGVITGDNYVFPVALNGKVNISSQTPLNKNELKNLMQSTLHLYGYSVVKNGRMYAIEPNEQAKKFSAKVDKSGKLKGEDFVIHIFPIKYANVADMLQALPFFMSDYGMVKNFSEVNAILVADTADNIQKIAQIIATIDNPENQAVDIIPLNHTTVGNVMPLLEKLAPRELSASARASYSPIRIVADDRANIIIVKGEESERQHMRTLIRDLDKPEDATDDMQVIYLQNGNAKDVADMLKDFIKVLPNDQATSIITIKADMAINALIVRAPRSYMQEIQGLVTKLDIQPAQVLIEAVIVEVTDDVSDSLGLQYGFGKAAASGTIGAASLTSGNVNIANFVTGLGVQPEAALLGEGVTAATGGKDFTVLLKALSTTSKANVLSTPHITTLDNVEAKIVVGQNVPFKTGTFTTNTSGVSNPFTTIERQDIGISLKVTPQISSHNQVRLKVEQEVSSLEPTITDGAADIITDKRTIDTVVIAENQSTVVLGGLISNSNTQSQSKVPILGDIPLLKYLFQSNSQVGNKRNLLIFLRPTVVRDNEDMRPILAKKLNGLWLLSLNEKPNAADATPILEGYYNPGLSPSTLPALPWATNASVVAPPAPPPAPLTVNISQQPVPVVAASPGPWVTNGRSGPVMH